jgi:uncharacterized protein YndB with AHSA1/START domain
MNTDRIEKTVDIKAPRSKVWNAIADSHQFGAWFGVKFDAPFAPGVLAEGHMTNPPDYAGRTFTFVVDRIEPEHLFSYRWHPYGIDPDYDYSVEPMTLVEFHLAEIATGTRLTVIESGFDSIPLARRAEALKMNTGGWEIQVANVARYVAG